MRVRGRVTGGRKSRSALGCQLQLAFMGHMLASAGRFRYASLSLDLPRNAGEQMGHPREVPSLDPWILEGHPNPHPKGIIRCHLKPNFTMFVSKGA